MAEILLNCLLLPRGRLEGSFIQESGVCTCPEDYRIIWAMVTGKGRAGFGKERTKAMVSVLGHPLFEKHVVLSFLPCLDALISTPSPRCRPALNASEITSRLDCGFCFVTSLFNPSNHFGSLCPCQTKSTPLPSSWISRAILSGGHS